MRIAYIRYRSSAAYIHTTCTSTCYNMHAHVHVHVHVVTCLYGTGIGINDSLYKLRGRGPRGRAISNGGGV